MPPVQDPFERSFSVLKAHSTLAHAHHGPSLHRLEPIFLISDTAANQHPWPGVSIPNQFSTWLNQSLSGWATSTTAQSTATDPADVEALRCLEQGTQKLEEGDVEAAKRLYKRSTDIKRNASSLFNLGVTHYHLSVSSQ
jgi:hypothetical protein